MKRIFLLICFLCCLHTLLAQTVYNVSGTIRDTTGQEMIGANVWLMAGRDTMHTISNDAGKFIFRNVPQPVFTIRVTVIGYDTWYHEFSYKEAGTQIDLPLIKLSIKTSTLKEVVIKGSLSPVVMKEDTIEYRADQYHLRANAVAEDLLKRLPGMQVDMEGNVQTMGKRITKVRINGKDFMITDIKTLTRLLPVDLIDKIQLIDDYGDLARATGRKTGEPEKIINIQTKADLEKVYQGQALGGVGNDGRYNAAVLANYFSEKQQLSINGNTNNISAQVGNTITSTVNANYRGNFSKEFSMNVGVIGGRTTSDMESLSTSKTVTTDGTLSSINTSNNSSRNDNYNINVGAEYKPKEGDMVNFNLNYSGNKSFNSSMNSAIQSGLQRKDQISTGLNNNTTPVFLAGLFASHRFKGLGRIVSMGLYVNTTKNNNLQDGIDSLRYYNPDSTIAKDSLLHQILDKKNNTFTSNAQLSYVEPLDSANSLELRYSVNYNHTDNGQETHWINPDGKTNFIDSLSNRYIYTMVQHQVELNFRRSKNKWDYTFGMRLQPASLTSSMAGGLNRAVVTSNKLVPVFRIQYKLTKQSMVSLSYSGNVIFPTYQQLQPVPDLTNAQFPIIGNPDLRPAFAHSVFFNYRTAGMNTLFVHLSGNFTQDKVVTNVSLVKDTFNTVKQETRFLNTNGDYNFRFIYGWSYRLADGKYNLFLDGNSSYNNNILYMDNVRKTGQNLMITQSVRANMLREFVELTTGVAYTYNRNVYVLQQNSITNIGTWNFNLNGKVYFLKTFSLGADVNKQLNSGYSGALSANPLMVNATLEKMLFKRKLTVRLQGFNLLDETSRLSQSISGNTVTENQNRLLGRYFMATLQCDLRLLKGK
ncbi:TonB-dependent receptor [Chitinophaga ginsengisoli]|uniref:Outer membrane receptor protein involved in Fe transport n=1 Tax=Chitinophaga ginsengisoli TaxID=363837 RepID=A0A2P8G9N7_9BACT|nr:TonB-dependent receptor [Chitinophaga ginsengisoli]PSL30681.1 outer membrane receptor protein involved in Fe transport [Chitinophaga ginsengisoli]